MAPDEATERAAVLSTVAHDLRTPLATIAGFARTIQRIPAAPEDRDRYLRLIVEAAEDMERLLDDVSVVGRVESGRFQPGREPVALAALAADACAAARPYHDGRAPALGPPSTDERVLTAPREAARAVGELAMAALRLDPRRAEATVTAVPGGIRVDAYADDVADLVRAGSRDLPLLAARAALRGLDGTLEIGADGVGLIRLPPAT